MSEHHPACRCSTCRGDKAQDLARLAAERDDNPANAPPDGGSFNAADIQAWVDSLTPRESAMLAHLVGDKEFRAAVEALGAAAEGVAGIARGLADKGDRNASAAVRSVVGVILRVQRQAMEAGRAHAGLPARETAH